MVGSGGGQCLIEAGEAGDAPVQARYGQDTNNRPVGRQDQSQLTAFVQGPPVCRVQHVKLRRIAGPGAGEIYHDGRVPVRGGLEEAHPELLRGDHVDLSGRGYYGQAVEP